MVDYSPALMTDMYEYTMLDAALKDGTADRKCVFEVFTRHLPEGRRYGVVAGTGRILDARMHATGDVDSIRAELRFRSGLRRLTYGVGSQGSSLHGYGRTPH